MKKLLLAVLLTQMLAVNATIAAPEQAQGSMQTRAKTLSLGVDQKLFALINEGKWQDVCTALEPSSQNKTTADKQAAWLAFAYLYLDRCDDLGKLAGKFSAGDDSLSSVLIEALNQACQKKVDDAKKLLLSYMQGNGQEASKDLLFNFSLAAVYSKGQDPTKAVEYCQKDIDLNPKFVWGYRTLGVLYEKWLLQPGKAEAQYESALAVDPNMFECRDLLTNLLLSRNDFDDAIDVCQAGIKAGAHNANSYFRLAQIYIEQWRLREALTLLDKAIAIAGSGNADAARFHHAKASILRFQGDLAAAILEQQKAVSISKDKSFELIELANLNTLAQNANRAADNLKEALTYDPSNFSAHQKLVEILLAEKRYDELEAEYGRAISLKANAERSDAQKANEALLHLGFAKALQQEGKIDQAIAEAKKSALLQENNPEPYRVLGAIYLLQKDYVQAAKEYTRALNIDPGSVDDLLALGFAYKSNDDFLQAETAYVTAIALKQLAHTTNPNQAGQDNQAASANVPTDLLRTLGELFLLEGRYIEAAQQFDSVCSVEKGHANESQYDYDLFLEAKAKALRDRTKEVAADLVSAYQQLPADRQKSERLVVVQTLIAAEQVSKALKVMRELSQDILDSDNDWLLLQAACLRKQGAYQEALAKAKVVASSTQDQNLKSLAYLELASTSLASGDTAAATADITHALEANAKSADAFYLLGKITFLQGNAKQALEQAKSALEINPYFARAYLLAGDVLLKEGDSQSALAAYKKALDTYPGLIDVHRALLAAYKKLALANEAKQEESAIANIQSRQ